MVILIVVFVNRQVLNDQFWWHDTTFHPSAQSHLLPLEDLRSMKTIPTNNRLF